MQDEQPVKMGEGSKPRLHYLWHNGEEALRRYRGYEEVLWSPSGNNLSPVFVPHRLAVGDVRISATLDAEINGFDLHTWLDEDLFRRENFRLLVKNNGRSDQVLFHPDGLSVLRAGDRNYHAAWEVDRSTESGAVWAKKVKLYQQYLGTGAHRQRFHTDDLRVLTIVHSAQRLANLLQVTETVGGGRRFLFAVREQVLEHSVFTAPIWRSAGRGGLGPFVPGN